MCSFMVSTSKKISLEAFEKNFHKMDNRGPDMSKVIENDNNILGFSRLSIMGISESGMQPFYLNKDYCVCNGEIYNYQYYREILIKEGYSFKSQSDCEVLLPMYQKYGVNMFKLLDAEFALVIYDHDKNTYLAARDPIGIRPLFYGYLKNTKDIIFASTANALIEICDKVIPFPPGYYYYEGKFIEYYDPTKSTYHECNLEEIFSNIHHKLVGAVSKRLNADVNVGFLLSGGLDSSLVCAIASKQLNKPIHTFAVGMSKDAIDLKYAKIVSEYLKSIHTEVIIDEKQVLSSLKEVIYELATYDITTIRASLGMYLVSKWIHENTNIKVLLTGEVSDELFGYKYTDFAPDQEAFQKESEKRIKELYMYDCLRADRMISSNSLEARVPFADLDFVNYVMGIDPKLKMNTYGIGKYLLRKSFDTNYLPESILMREKAAFSDAVGHSMVDYLKEYASNYYTDQEYQEKITKYPNNQPFTKESLLYREIFETYYPNQSEMIIDYWMPNKSWEGCNVNDPSARVLSNYGKSGL